eukprot:CAMPEP_0174251686 /NCGR_PEP_ID=MMETSP0439-20130205/1422_1 /TAXON_ID=0 /ORGANISM="Stereomyxa ramosa, Strain Chinc5" /LENGTH=376 /DNA_ID=CAMNT_0015332059 /DNA_START=57 /DNA_END=1187 /DNA_ORIENTATION=+
MQHTIHVRAETKPNERRVPLTPANAAKMLEAGFQIFIEESDMRIFPSEEYEKVGCTIVPFGSWREAEPSTLILGLKELPENDDSALVHTHIFFGHCFKNQTHWDTTLSRWIRGNGRLLDLEFLVNDTGRRVAAFGRAAGLAGCAVGIMAWCQQQINIDEPLPSLDFFNSIDDLVEFVSEKLAEAQDASGKVPKVMIMGALGRCGKGATEFLQKVSGMIDETAEWDLAETAKGGPFPEILDYDIFINCIYLTTKIPPFITPELVAQPGRALSVVVDVSCDYTNADNPLPIYNDCTTFIKPTLRTIEQQGQEPALDVVAIDHLPSLIPRESSTDFSNDLLPTLLALKDFLEGVSSAGADVWKRAQQTFLDKCALVSSD